MTVDNNNQTDLVAHTNIHCLTFIFIKQLVLSHRKKFYFNIAVFIMKSIKLFQIIFIYTRGVIGNFKGRWIRKYV